MDICPSWIGGKNWQPTSFNPGTGFLYVAANNMCTDITSTEVTYRRGLVYWGESVNVYLGPGDYRGELLAWDPVNRRKAWELKLPLPFNGGTMTTAGNLVFFGDITGEFRALNATTGKSLWHVNVGTGIGAGAMSFEVGGKQCIAIVAGRTVSLPAGMGEPGKQIAAVTPEGGTLLVFTLGD